MIIEGTNIRMIRGDTEAINVNMQNIQGDVVPFEEGDTVYFTVKTSTVVTEKILQKVVTTFVDGSAFIVLHPEETRELQERAYVYDIQVTRADGTVKTIIPPSQFVLMGDVTHE